MAADPSHDAIDGPDAKALKRLVFMMMGAIWPARMSRWGRQILPAGWYFLPHGFALIEREGFNERVDPGRTVEPSRSGYVGG